MPDVVTHLYDPVIGVCPNLCSLNDNEALRVLDQLRRTFRPTLKLNYLARRRSTELWLSEAAGTLLAGIPSRDRQSSTRGARHESQKPLAEPAR